ncbi:Hypothetical protein ABZS17D1_01650 [Kosakonia cowanii]
MVFLCLKSGFISISPFSTAIKKGRQLATFLNKGIEPPHALAVNPLPATTLPQSKTE